MKQYTEEELKKRISKKYHYMIDWKNTLYMGFDGTIELIDNGQTTKALPKSLYNSISNISWYLREIEKDKESEW